MFFAVFALAVGAAGLWDVNLIREKCQRSDLADVRRIQIERSRRLRVVHRAKTEKNPQKELREFKSI